MNHTFHTPEPVVLRVELREGAVRVLAEETDTTTVELTGRHGDPGAESTIEAARVEQRGNEIIVMVPKMKMGLFGSQSGITATITVPVDSSAHLTTKSADIETTGVLGDLSATTGSGEIRVQHAAEATIRTGSGDVDLGTATRDCDIKGGSSDVKIGHVAGNATVMTGSGDMVVDTVVGVLKVKAGSGDLLVKSGGAGVDAVAGSGDLLVKRVDHGRVKARTGSGDVSVGVAEGTAAYLDVSTVTGDVVSELQSSEEPQDGPTVELIIQSGSGDVVLQRA